MGIDMNMIAQIVENSNKVLNAPKGVKDAKKDYYDEYLTGLTDDEKKEIEEKVAAYLKNKKLDVNNKNDMDNLKDYIAGLLKQYGFKGDIEEMADGMAFKAILDKESNPREEVRTNFSINEIKEAYQNALNINKFSNQFV